MTNPNRDLDPVSGLYERLITDSLEKRIKALGADGWSAVDEVVGSESAPHVLSRHIASTAERVLAGLSPAEQVVAANLIIESMSSIEGARQATDLISDGPRQLLALAEREAEGVYAIRPATPSRRPR